MSDFVPSADVKDLGIEYDPTLSVTTSATFIADRGDKQVFCVYADTAYATVSAGATADAELQEKL